MNLCGYARRSGPYRRQSRHQVDVQRPERVGTVNEHPAPAVVAQVHQPLEQQEPTTRGREEMIKAAEKLGV